jgi:transposase InsO family protein
LCDLFGRSRQAYYQRNKYNYREAVKEEILLQLVEKERSLMPKLGGRKLFGLILPYLSRELSIGRDSFFDFLRRNGLLVGKRRRRIKTTYSNHWLHKYSNLIKGFVPFKANQLWVSDITFVITAEGFVLLNLITDAYSRKIVGWAVGATLEAIYTIEALNMALDQLPKNIEGLIHHSDRGVQYCCNEYVKVLNKYHVQISMTENGDPRENAIAERVNGILKDEWLNQMKLESLEHAIKELKQIIMIYNTCRPHSSLDMNTPEYVHSQSGEFKKRWKTYYKTTITTV